MTHDADAGYVDKAYATGLYAPVAKEVIGIDLPTAGRVPFDLAGIFAQATPNPAFPPGPGHSWFDGDGMVQSVAFKNGRATYRNRYVRTTGLEEDLAAGRATYVGSLAKPGLGKRHKNVANTDLVWHAGRLLALWWEGGTPYELSLPELATVGEFDYQGTLTRGLTSHAKLDPATRELFFISWSARAPFLTVSVASHEGRVIREVPVDLPGPRVQHDMGLSARFIAVFDFPLGIDLKREGNAMGFRMTNQPSRIGLLSRQPGEDAVRWFDVQPCYMWHTLCAYDENDEFVLLGARSADAVNQNSAGQARNDRPLVDGEHRFDTLLHEWRLNVRTGAVSERALDDVLIELPRVNDSYICSGARYGYVGLLDEVAPTFRFKGIAKYDLKTGQRTDIIFPEGHFANEPNYVSVPSPTAEDDGYVVAFVTNIVTEMSQLWIVRADAFGQGPVARIDLPQRVPAGFHGRWIPQIEATA